MGQHRASDTGPAAEARQEDLRRLSGACFVVGAFAIALTVYLGGLLTERPHTLIVPVLFAVTSGAVCLTFPWRRYDPRWFMLMCVPANLVLVASARLTGGVESPVTSFFYVVVAIAGAYHGGRIFVGQVLFTAAMAAAVVAFGPAPLRPGMVVAHAIVELLALTAVALVARTAVARRENPARRQG